MTPERIHTPSSTETEVLAKSARRCVLCFLMSGDLKEKRGQIAHLDEDPSNFGETNLAFMCLDHHSLYDSKTSQHKNYTVREVKVGRTKLYRAIAIGKHFAGAEAIASGIERRKPRLNVVFNPQQCTWGISGIGQKDGSIKKAMTVAFWGTFASDDDNVVLEILEAYPEGTRQQLGTFRFRVPPKGRPIDAMVHAIVLPILGMPRSPLTVRFVLKDQFGRVYKTNKTIFRWVSSGIEKLPD